MTSILLIEDDALFREALALALTDNGYVVVQACEGEEGARRFRAEPTDLVITDIVMPNKDGLATIRELRRDYHRLGIIAMSGGLARAAPLYLKVADTIGANRTLDKPFELTELLAAIGEVLTETGGIPPTP